LGFCKLGRISLCGKTVEQWLEHPMNFPATPGLSTPDPGKTYSRSKFKQFGMLSASSLSGLPEELDRLMLINQSSLERGFRFQAQELRFIPPFFCRTGSLKRVIE
jgi:hypothetical protein